MDMADVLKKRRAELGISQTTLGEMAGVNVRQIARYESGEQHPSLPQAVELAKALSISIAELAGEVESGMDLSGEWHAGWQTYKDGVQRLAIQEVVAHQHGNLLQVSAERTVAVEEGGYNWAGEFRLWDNEVLMGWYRGADGSVRSKGTMYFALQSGGEQATGRWVGLSYDGRVVTGNSSLARSADDAESILESLIEEAKS